MRTFSPSLAFAVAALTAAACTDEPTALPSDSVKPEVVEARGGVPGPPGTVLLPDVRRGPPPRVPVPLPPRAGPPSFIEGMSQVGAGGKFTCALDRDGAAFCWGGNGFGFLGDGSTTSSATPVPVSGGHVFAELSVGDRTTCGIDDQGAAWCWGFNGVGELGAGTSARFSAVPLPVAGGLRFTSIHVGLGATCGIVTDGSAWCWGQGGQGRLGDGAGVNSSAPVMVAGSDALGFVDVRPGFPFTCAVDGGDEVYCWGQDGGYFGNAVAVTGSLVPVPAANGVALRAIRPGGLYTCGLDASGTAWCWGNANPVGQQGLGSVSPAPIPTPVVGGLTFRALDTNDNNSILGATCGIDDADRAWCWGSNHEGQLGASSSDACAFGSGIYDCSLSPIPVTGGLSFESISVGITHVCGVTTDDRLYCWGENDVGQLGDGTLTDRIVPTPVLDLAGAGAIAP